MRELLNKLRSIIFVCPDWLYAFATSISWLILQPKHRKVLIIPYGKFWLFYDLMSNLKVVAPTPKEECRFSLSETYERYFQVKGGVVLDVGAELGGFTLSVAHRCDKVVAIEPDPVNLQLLKTNVQINKLNNVIIIPKAVWNKRGLSYLYRFNRSGWHSLIYRSPIRVKVETDTLDNIVPSSG